ncbi:cilia- and flagella-associated protein 57-like [Oncorhynchus clarkii lewisi]|uniref:cilia- and flagella-associated protein 57-like n=1 Tax=Oncorhynchus clarkii lewisi TaxID=490388 RepID=UPI0039B845AF
MSGVVAQCHYCFGLRTGVANNLCYFDEQTVIFPSGNNCVRYNIDQKWQRFIPGLERSQGMYALSISSNRRYLAVSECGERATITVYDLQHEQSQKRKVLSGGDIPVHEFVSMAFSTDSKHFIGQSGAPDYILFYWMWEKQKIMAMVETTVAANPVNQVSLNPYDNTQICVSVYLNQVMLELKMRVEELKMENEYQLRLNNEDIKEMSAKFVEQIESLKTRRQCQEESRIKGREFEESRKQMEEDGDREIQDIRIRYERWLKDERETNMRMKGDTSIMKKKFSSLQNNIDDRSMEKEKMKTEQQKLLAHQMCLERDILALKKEIQERDDTIQDKEKCIYDLKKKNQELGKFKFVLDYKIKELKKQIEPRENDIKEMKEQTHEMEQELDTFHKKNAQQELDIAELKLKLTTTDKEMHKGLQKVRDVEALVRRFKTDLHNCVGFTQEPKRLKDMLVDIVGVDAEVQREYARHREHLERNVASLKRKLAKDGVVHHADNVKIMQENATLIREINDLRKELRLVRSQVHDYKSLMRKQGKKQTNTLKALLSPRANPSNMVVRLNQEGDRIVQLQRLEIHRLREEIQVLMKIHPYRPPSTAKLPSLQINS